MMPQWKKNLYITWFTQILSLTGFGFGLPFIPYFIQELGVTDPEQVKTWVGLTSSIPALSMGLIAPVWGLLSDRFGKKLMILRSMLAGSLIVGAIGFSQNVQTIFLLRLFQGFFTGTITAAATLVASGTPKGKLSSALGFLSSSTFIGFSLGPLAGGLAAEYFGYRTSFFIGSAILFTGFFLVLFFTREVRAEDEPEEDSSAPEGATAEPQSLSGFFFLRNPFLIMLSVLFFMRFCRSFTTPFLPLHVQDSLGTIEGAASRTGAISAAAGFATALSGITLGRLGDRYDRTKLVSIYLAAAAVISFPIFWTTGLSGFTLFYVLTAFALGGVEPNLQSTMSVATPAGNRGVLFGVQTLVGSMGWFFSPMTSSYLSIRYSVQHIFLFYSIFIFLTFCVIFVYRSIAGRSRERAAISP